jgi:hypothetical protein
VAHVVGDKAEAAYRCGDPFEKGQGPDGCLGRDNALPKRVVHIALCSLRNQRDENWNAAPNGLIDPRQWRRTLAKRPKFADDPIPIKAIRLSAAFERVVEAFSKNPKVVEKLEEQDIDCSPIAKAGDRWKSQVAADVLLRAHLTYGELLNGEILYTYIRDPQTGEILQLDPGGWTPRGRSPKPFGIKDSPYFEMSAGIPGDHVIDPYDEIFPGPVGTLLHGAYRPVFFWRDEFERWFQKTFGSDSSKRRGRKPGSGSWEHADEPLVEEMHRLIDSGSAKSAEDAARLVEDRAAGSGTLVSKRTRLAKRYRKRFPSERN